MCLNQVWGQKPPLLFFSLLCPVGVFVVVLPMFLLYYVALFSRKLPQKKISSCQVRILEKFMGTNFSFLAFVSGWCFCCCFAYAFASLCGLVPDWQNRRCFVPVNAVFCFLPLLFFSPPLLGAGPCPLSSSSFCLPASVRCQGRHGLATSMQRCTLFFSLCLGRHLSPSPLSWFFFLSFSLSLSLSCMQGVLIEVSEWYPLGCEGCS